MYHVVLLSGSLSDHSDTAFTLVAAAATAAGRLTSASGDSASPRILQGSKKFNVTLELTVRERYLLMHSTILGNRMKTNVLRTRNTENNYN